MGMIVNLIHSASIVILAIAILITNLHVTMLRKRIDNIEAKREALYASFADPDKIEADFEKSARAREMRDAQRTTLPREDAGPPAKVWRPKMRGAKPGNWRVNRP